MKQDPIAELHHVREDVAATELPPGQRRTHGALLLARYALFLACLGVVTLAVYWGRTLALDVAVTRFVQGYHAGWYTWLLTHVSDLGFWPANIVTYAVVTMTLIALRLSREAAVALISSLLVSGAAGVLKRMVNRPRPSPHLVHVAAHLSDPSFPSGHVVQYTVFFGFLFYIVLITWHRSFTRDLAVVLCALLVILVGPSRVFLGEHWASDTLGAYVLAGIWLGVTIEVYLLLLPRAACSPVRRIGLHRT